MHEISFIIVNYNTDNYVKSLINNINALNIKSSYEIIVANNSTKCIFPLVESLGVVKYIHLPRNPGFGTACNASSKIAEGKFLIFVNPDIIFNVDPSIAIRSNHLNNNIIGGIIYDEFGKISINYGNFPTIKWLLIKFFKLYKIFPYLIKKYSFGVCGKFSGNCSVVVPFVSGAMFIIKSEIFDKLGGFDENFFLYFEEVDLAYRALLIGTKSVIDPRISCQHFGSVSMPNKHFKSICMENSLRYFFKKHHTSPKIADFVLRIVGI